MIVVKIMDDGIHWVAAVYHVGSVFNITVNFSRIAGSTFPYVGLFPDADEYSDDKSKADCQKGNWKNHLQPITNKYCDELGLSIMPAEYSRNPKNISRDKWEKEMSMKDIILRDAKMCAYAAGNVEHFKYLMKRLGYVFKKDAWMEVQAPGFRYYHKLAKMDEMFSEDMLKHP